MKNIKLIKLWMWIIFTLIPNLSFAQSNNDNWERIGKIFVNKPLANHQWESKQELAFLYGQFDGNQMIFKIYVPVDDRSYDVITNQNYNKSLVDYCNERSSKDDHFKGPWPKIIERYPQKAGPYYLNSANYF